MDNLWERVFLGYFMGSGFSRILGLFFFTCTMGLDCGVLEYCYGSLHFVASLLVPVLNFSIFIGSEETLSSVSYSFFLSLNEVCFL